MQSVLNCVKIFIEKLLVRNSAPLNVTTFLYSKYSTTNKHSFLVREGKKATK